MTYKVTAVHRLRYLGFFLDHKLRWEHHVNVMCNRARASIRALQLLGNSVRGLNFAQWRLAYNAICLPVLTYGCQLWYTGKQKGLVQKLQVVQNEGVRLLAGAFRTTPREPLQHLFNILPMNLHLRMLTDNAALRPLQASAFQSGASSPRRSMGSRPRGTNPNPGTESSQNSASRNGQPDISQR